MREESKLDHMVLGSIAFVLWDLHSFQAKLHLFFLIFLFITLKEKDLSADSAAVGVVHKW